MKNGYSEKSGDNAPFEHPLQWHQANVANYYDEDAPYFDEMLELTYNSQIHRQVSTLFNKHNIRSGTLLDVACGSGTLQNFLGTGFSYTGIDLSPNMVEEARKKGYEGIVGPAEDVLKSIPDKSFDHAVVLSALYFIKDAAKVVHELERIARASVTITIEKRTEEHIAQLRGMGINLYTHPLSILPDPSEILDDVVLWTRTRNDGKPPDEIRGAIMLKLLKSHTSA